MRLRRLQNLTTLDARDVVLRNANTTLPFGATAFADFTTDNRFVDTGLLDEINGVQLTPIVQSVSSGVGPYVASNDRSVLLNGRIAYALLYSSSPLLGVRIPSATRNLTFKSDDFGGTSWTRTNITVNGTVNGPGSGTSATRVTATANNATITQTRTGASIARTFRVFARSVSASANIELTVNNFTTIASHSINSSWNIWSVTTVAANPVLGIRIVNSGDSIDLWVADYETGTIVSDDSEVIITTAAASASTMTGTTLQWEALPVLNSEVTKSIYYQVIAKRGVTRLSIVCEELAASAGFIYMDIGDGEIAVSGEDKFGGTFDYTFLGDFPAHIVVTYDQSASEILVYVNNEVCIQGETGSPVAFAHAGDTSTINRTRHYAAKFGIWDRVLDIGEIRALSRNTVP